MSTTLYGVVEDVRRGLSRALSLMPTSEEPIWVMTREGRQEVIYSVVNDILERLGTIRNSAIDLYLLASSILVGDADKANKYYSRAVPSLGASLSSIDYVLEALTLMIDSVGEDMPAMARRALIGGAAMASYSLSKMPPRLCIATENASLQGLYAIEVSSYMAILNSRFFEVLITSDTDSEEYENVLQLSIELRRILALNLYARGTDRAVALRLGDEPLIHELPKCGDELLNATSPGLREIVCMGAENGRLSLIHLAMNTVPFLGSIDAWVAFPGAVPSGIGGSPAAIGGPQGAGAAGGEAEIPFDLTPERPGPGEGEAGGDTVETVTQSPVEVTGIGEEVGGFAEDFQKRIEEINRRIIDLSSIARRFQVDIPGDLGDASIFNALFNASSIAGSPRGEESGVSYGLEAFVLFSVLLGFQAAREQVGPMARLVRLARYARRGDNPVKRAVACYEVVSKILKYRGLERLSGETPREYLERVSGFLSPDEVRVVRAATESLEQALYRASNPDPRVLEECINGYGVLVKGWLSIRRR